MARPSLPRVCRPGLGAGESLRFQLAFEVYLRERQDNPRLRFREQLRRIGGAIEERLMSESDDQLPEAERARVRRRDRDAAAQERELMNDGSAKWFKQVLDRQAKLAKAEKEGRRRRA
jgi:hypothetical protein